jgi:hypothetical protein
VSSIKYEPDAATLAEFEAWCTDPERKHIEQTIRKYSPFHCYRGPNNGHYAVLSYQHDGKRGRVGHAWDSFLPGCAVFGFELAKLEVCDCGEFSFEMPEIPEAVEA